MRMRWQNQVSYALPENIIFCVDPASDPGDHDNTIYCNYAPNRTCARTRGTRWKLWNWQMKESLATDSSANKVEVEIHLDIVDEEEEMD